MGERLKTTIWAGSVAVVVSVISFVVVASLWPEPDWKASGDGKTIFNSRTGEIRYTITGQSVREVAAEQAAVLEKLDREASEYRQRADAEHKDREMKRTSVQANNSVIYHKLKEFVDSHPIVRAPWIDQKRPDDSVDNVRWETLTRPFRTNKLLSREDHEELLNFLSLCVAKEPYSSDPSFRLAIDELKKWDFTVW